MARFNLAGSQEIKQPATKSACIYPIIVYDNAHRPAIQLGDNKRRQIMNSIDRRIAERVAKERTARRANIIVGTIFACGLITILTICVIDSPFFRGV